MFRSDWYVFPLSVHWILMTLFGEVWFYPARIKWLDFRDDFDQSPDKETVEGYKWQSLSLAFATWQHCFCQWFDICDCLKFCLFSYYMELVCRDGYQLFMLSMDHFEEQISGSLTSFWKSWREKYVTWLNVFATKSSQHFSATFLRTTAGTAIARLSYRNSVRLSVRHMGGSVKNGASLHYQIFTSAARRL